MKQKYFELCKQLEDRNYDLIKENKIIQAELKNSLRTCTDLEKKLQKIKVYSIYNDNDYSKNCNIFLY